MECSYLCSQACSCCLLPHSWLLQAASLNIASHSHMSLCSSNIIHRSHKKVQEKKKRIFCSAHGRRPPCTHRSIEFLFCYPSLMCSLCGSRLNVWHVGWGSRTVKSVPRVDSNNILLLFLFVGTRPTQRDEHRRGTMLKADMANCIMQQATEGQVKLATRLMLVIYPANASLLLFWTRLCLVPVANRPLKYRIPRIWKWNGTSRFESIWDGVFWVVLNVNLISMQTYVCFHKVCVQNR